MTNITKMKMKRILYSGVHFGLALAVLGASLVGGAGSANAAVIRFQQKIPVSPGVDYQTIHYDNSGTRHAVNIFTVDATSGGFVGLGKTDPLHQLTTTSTQAQKVHDSGTWVAGAINGAFNETDGSGMPATMIMQDNRLIHLGRLSPGQDGYNFYRNAFGVNRDGVSTIAEYSLDVELYHGDKTFRVSSMNTSRVADGMSIFTALHRWKTVGNDSSSYATEIVVEGVSQPLSSLPVGQEVTGTVTEIYRIGAPTNAQIPEDGFAISAHGQQWAEALQDVQQGDQITLQVTIDDTWKDAKYLIQTGPRLLKDGQVQISMNESSLQARTSHPRSAVAVNADGTKAFLVTVDGRQSGYSQGMTLQELGDYLLSIGAHQAINLDGGGSTTAVLRVPGTDTNMIANKPSDGTQRGVSTSLLAVSEGPADFASGQMRIIDLMEEADYWHTNTARAQASLSMVKAPQPVRIGDRAVQFKYDFTASESGVSAAYLSYNHPKILMDRPLEIGAWVFSDGKPNWLRATLLDRNKNQVIIDFTEDGGMAWSGWRYLRAKVPDSIAYPISLQRIYVAQTRDERKDKGTLYIDQIEAIYESDYTVQRFTDVAGDHWALTNIIYLSDKNIISGYFDGSFKPDRKISREHAAIMLVRELGLSTEGRSNPEFSDVLDTSPSYKAIATVAATGLMVGKEPGKFMPAASLTRAEMAVILDRAYSLFVVEEKDQFKDVSETHWASVSIKNLANSGITGGYPDGTFKPSGELSRAEFATFMARIMVQNNR